MQLQNQSCASALPLALIATLQAPQPPREQRLNRASRGLNGQFIDGASRRLKSQRLEGASRRLNSQSVAGAAIAARMRSSSFLPEACVVAARTARSGSCCPAVTSCKSGTSPARGAPPVSSPGEPPPQALSEPYVRLSPHTAPSVQPPRHPSDLAFRPRLLLRRVGPVRAKAEPPAPLRSSPITGPSTLLRALLPPCPASVLWLSWCPPLELLPSHRDDRFSCSSSKPDSCSCRLYAGHR